MSNHLSYSVTFLCMMSQKSIYEKGWFDFGNIIPIKFIGFKYSPRRPL